MKTVNIVGGGISGLTAGIYLLKNNYKVNIYEKNNNVGGFCTSWKRKGQTIDGCIHWLMGTHKDSRIGKIWREIGGFTDEDVIQLNSFYKVYHNGETLTFYNDFDKLERELYRVGKEDDLEIQRLMDVLRYLKMYEIDTSMPSELSTEPSKPNMEFVKKTVRFLNCTVEQYANRFNSPIIRYAFLNGLVDKHFCAIYLVQTLSNFCMGNAYVIRGGSSKVMENVLSTFKSLGGNVYLNSNVEQIIVENGEAKGIKVENKGEIFSDYVIAACDVHHTYKHLLGDKIDYNEYLERDNNKEKYPTYSFIVASFKTKENLKNHEVAEIYKVEPYTILGKEYDSLCVRHYGYDDSLMTDGYTTIEVFVATYEEDYDKLKTFSKEEYRKLKNEIADILKERLESVYGVKEELILIDTLSPLTYERYLNSYKGSFMSYPLGVKTPQKIQSNKVKEVKNLYLANQWLMLPGGTPIAVTMGKFASQMIIADR